ncbi:amidase family protein [Mesorhizobium sp. CC13]|uniref:amidase n=1 Tax=Mesorhizobium sp. CC13 TaxID=3029194 RepID=UPI00326669CD
MASDPILSAMPAVELRQLIASREVSSVELVSSCIAQIERFNPVLNAIVTLADEAALDAAKQADSALARGDRVGPLHGLPIVIKDISETAGIRTTYASPLYRENVPDADCEAVSRLRKAGAIILGKTSTPEFAAGANTVNSVFGATRNPWNTELSPAGSSGGSAVAVASGMVPIGHGTDFGCSLRMPASFCGVVGLRTTPGLIPNAPMVASWDPGQVHGPLARTAEDAALMLDGMTGFDGTWPISIPAPWDSALDAMRRSGGPKGKKFAFAPDLAGIGVEPEIDRLCRSAAALLSEAGGYVEECGFSVPEAIDIYRVLRAQWMVEQQLDRLDQMDQMDQMDQVDQVDPNLAGNVKLGLGQSVLDLARAQHARDVALKRFRELFNVYDFLITPTSPVEPFPVTQNFPTEIGGRKLASYTDWMAPCFLITLVSLVSVSVPVGLSRSGLPVGLQIVGPRLSEPAVLAIAAAIQEAAPIGIPPMLG